MFEDILPQPDRNGRPRRDRALGILVTVLVHALLGLLVYHGRFTVKILPFGKQEVRSVVIVPPLTVSLPKSSAAGDSRTSRAGSRGFPSRRPSPRAGRRRGGTRA